MKKIFVNRNRNTFGTFIYILRFSNDNYRLGNGKIMKYFISVFNYKT